jgi:hypothetical protein
LAAIDGVNRQLNCGIARIGRGRCVERQSRSSCALWQGDKEHRAIDFADRCDPPLGFLADPCTQSFDTWSATPSQQIWQLGDIAGNPSRLVLAEQFGGRAPVLTVFLTKG